MFSLLFPHPWKYGYMKIHILPWIGNRREEPYLSRLLMCSILIKHTKSMWKQPASTYSQHTASTNSPHKITSSQKKKYLKKY